MDIESNKMDIESNKMEIECERKWTGGAPTARQKVARGEGERSEHEAPGSQAQETSTESATEPLVRQNPNQICDTELNPCLSRFAEDGLRQDPQIHRDFGWFEGALVCSVVRQQREFRIAELAGREVLPDQRGDHRRELLRAKREQRARRRTSGRFSE